MTVSFIDSLNFTVKALVGATYQLAEGAIPMSKLRNSTILILKGLLTAQISLSVPQQATMFRINFFCNVLAGLSEEIVK